MNRSVLVKLAVVAAFLVAAYFVNVAVQTRLGQSARAETGLPDRDLATALTLAGAENKLALAELSAVWCPTCRALDKTIFADPAVQAAIKERFVFARIEYESDEGAAFMERYAATGFPTLLALRPNGEIAARLPVTKDSATFLQALAEAKL